MFLIEKLLLSNIMFSSKMSTLEQHVRVKRSMNIVTLDFNVSGCNRLCRDLQYDKKFGI